MTLKERKQEAVRGAIWDAAMTLFSAKGFDETTIDEIAEASGVSRRSFFRYFASKNDLMAHAMLQYGAGLAAAIEACPAEDPPATVFRTVVLELAVGAAADPRTRVAMEIGAKHPAAHAAELSRLLDAQRLVAQAYAKRKGFRKHPAGPDLLAGITMHTLGAVFHLWFEQKKQPADISAATRQVLATLDSLLAC